MEQSQGLGQGYVVVASPGPEQEAWQVHLPGRKILMAAQNCSSLFLPCFMVSKKDWNIQGYKKYTSKTTNGKKKSIRDYQEAIGDGLVFKSSLG